MGKKVVTSWGANTDSHGADTIAQQPSSTSCIPITAPILRASLKPTPTPLPPSDANQPLLTGGALTDPPSGRPPGADVTSSPSDEAGL